MNKKMKLKDFTPASIQFPIWEDANKVLLATCISLDGWNIQIQTDNDTEKIVSVNAILKFRYTSIPDEYMERIKSIVAEVAHDYVPDFSVFIEQIDSNIDNKIMSLIEDYEKTKVLSGHLHVADELCYRLGIELPQDLINHAIKTYEDYVDEYMSSDKPNKSKHFSVVNET